MFENAIIELYNCIANNNYEEFANHRMVTYFRELATIDFDDFIKFNRLIVLLCKFNRYEWFKNCLVTMFEVPEELQLHADICDIRKECLFMSAYNKNMMFIVHLISHWEFMYDTVQYNDKDIQSFLIEALKDTYEFMLREDILLVNELWCLKQVCTFKKDVADHSPLLLDDDSRILRIQKLATICKVLKEKFTQYNSLSKICDYTLSDKESFYRYRLFYYELIVATSCHICLCTDMEPVGHVNEIVEKIHTEFKNALKDYLTHFDANCIEAMEEYYMRRYTDYKYVLSFIAVLNQAIDKMIVYYESVKL
uniref:Uncharacterized protein n=1 Tax=Helicoverpa armigera nucleopolyhedrovirus TaxID=51313 RepID=A0A482EUE0_9ABAC|nr:hypothetical protein [Helicoverpa armigera nucleopolyhedrovirus]